MRECGSAGGARLEEVKGLVPDREHREGVPVHGGPCARGAQVEPGRRVSPREGKRGSARGGVKNGMRRALAQERRSREAPKPALQAGTALSFFCLRLTGVLREVHEVLPEGEGVGDEA